MNSQGAVSRLVQHHGGRAYLAALSILRNEQDAREATQESLLLALRSIHRYDRTRPFYPWLHRIVRNHCIDRLRKKREILDQDAPMRLPEPGPGPETQAGLGETRKVIEQALGTLSPDYREILVLRHFQDLSYPEIALALKIPEGTVMSRLYRARQAMRKAMKTLGWKREDLT